MAKKNRVYDYTPGYFTYAGLEHYTGRSEKYWREMYRLGHIAPIRPPSISNGSRSGDPIFSRKHIDEFLDNYQEQTLHAKANGILRGVG